MEIWNDNYMYLVDSKFFDGRVRLDHYDGIVQRVDDGRMAWCKGKHISAALNWVKEKEEEMDTKTGFTKEQKEAWLSEHEDIRRKMEEIYERRRNTQGYEMRDRDNI